MNAFLRARTACGFEYLISFVAEHSDAVILRCWDIFRNPRNRPKNKENIVSNIQSWQNKKLSELKPARDAHEAI